MIEKNCNGDYWKDVSLLEGTTLKKASTLIMRHGEMCLKQAWAKPAKKLVNLKIQNHIEFVNRSSYRVGIWIANIGEAGSQLEIVIEANTKSWWPKSSQSRIVKLMDWGQVTQSRVEYQVEYVRYSSHD